MIYISVAEAAKKWGISERSVRNYCAEGRVAGARLSGKTWEIPEVAEKPKWAPRSDKKRTLLDILADMGGNILTINQSVPSGGAAAVGKCPQAGGHRRHWAV